MSESQDQQVPPQTDPKSPSSIVMAEAQEQQPPAATHNSSAAFSFSIWPPSERTREAVRNQLINTLSSPSVLSKRYGTVSREEAEVAAKRIEEEAFHAAVAAATSENDGLGLLEFYSKGISRRMLDSAKARSGVVDPVKQEPDPVEEKHREDDAGSTAPPQSEKTESVNGDE